MSFFNSLTNHRKKKSGFGQGYGQVRSAKAGPSERYEEQEGEGGEGYECGEVLLPFIVCFEVCCIKFSHLALLSLTNMFQNGNVLSGIDREI